MINNKDFTSDPLLNIEMMKNISEGVYLIRVDDFTFVYTNERFEKMLGYNPGEMLGKKVDIINAPTDKTPEETRKTIIDILTKDKEWHGEIENIKKDGTNFWCYANVSLFDYSEFGQVILAVHNDITENKKNINQLVESERKIKGIIENSTDSIFMLDKEYKYTMVNNMLAKNFGVSAKDLIGRSVSDMFPDPAASKLINNIKKVFDTGRNLSLDEMIIIQGKETYNNSSLNPIKNEQGEVVAVVGVVRDITEKKVLENELLEKKEELEIIFDYIPAWIFYKDTKNQFIKVNKTFAVAMEKTKEELEGKNLSNFYPKEQVDAFWKDDKEIIETSKPKMGIIESIDTPNGLRWVRTDKIPFKDKNGNILGIIGFTADITEIKLAEATVQKKMMELESMNKLMLNRELKMIELKKEIEELEKKKLV